MNEMNECEAYVLALMYRVSQKNCSKFDKILKNKDNVNKLMER